MTGIERIFNQRFAAHEVTLPADDIAEVHHCSHAPAIIVPTLRPSLFPRSGHHCSHAPAWEHTT